MFRVSIHFGVLDVFFRDGDNFIPLFSINIECAWFENRLGDFTQHDTDWRLPCHVNTSSVTTLVWVEKNKYLFISNIMYAFELPNDERISFVYLGRCIPYLHVINTNMQSIFYYLKLGKELGNDSMNISPDQSNNIVCVKLMQLIRLTHDNAQNFSPQDIVFPYNHSRRSPVRCWRQHLIFHPITLLTIDST